MDYEDYIAQGLHGDAPLKLILCGSVEDSKPGKVGVVSVVYATQDPARAEEKIREWSRLYPQRYYMVYSVPLDTDLAGLPHYPSIEITKEDLQ